MNCLLKVLTTVLVLIPRRVLDDVPLKEGQAVGVDVLSRLDLVLLVMIATDLDREWISQRGSP